MYVERHFLYRFHSDSFNALLDSYGLLFDLDLPLNTHSTALLQEIQSMMEASRFQYRFDTPQSLGASGMLPHESLPLSLLALVNRGRIHPSLDEILLRTERAHNLTIHGMVSDPSLRNRFAIPSLCIEDNRLVVHMCKISLKSLYYRKNLNVFCNRHSSSCRVLVSSS